MTEQFASVLASLRRIFPDDELETLSDPQLDTLRARHAGVPYLSGESTPSPVR